MKKIFKIAAYDFRRIILNPFSLIAIAVVLVACLILSATYKIPTSPSYEAVTQGETTSEVFYNFYSQNPNVDTKGALDKLLSDAQKILDVQKEAQNKDVSALSSINTQMAELKIQMMLYDSRNNAYYIAEVFPEIVEASNKFSSFMENYKNYKEFETRLILGEKEFKELQEICDYFSSTLSSTRPTEIILDELANEARSSEGHFEMLNSFIKNNNFSTWRLDSAKIEELKTGILDRAKEKTALIEAEMEKISKNGTSNKLLEDMSSLISAYKLTCQSCNFAIKAELEFALSDNFGNLDNLYGYQKLAKEETLQKLTKAKYFLADDSLYYTPYQEPLNFNIASSQITAFDNSYFIVSIIGFFTIIFGIFAAYKLFGRDRKNGKMDLVLSQDVTFGQVFAGKFTAIVLCTSFILGLFAVVSLVWALIFYKVLPGSILAVFNLQSAYTISPFLFLLIKLVGIELQVIFFATITIFLMNISRKFELMFAIALLLFAAITVCNLFLNNIFIYCLFPFIHVDLTSFLGGGKMDAGFLQTALYASGNFFISLGYYAVVVVLLYNFTNQLFKKN